MYVNHIRLLHFHSPIPYFNKYVTAIVLLDFHLHGFVFNISNTKKDHVGDEVKDEHFHHRTDVEFNPMTFDWLTGVILVWDIFYNAWLTNTKYYIVPIFETLSREHSIFLFITLGLDASTVIPFSSRINCKLKYFFVACIL